MAITASASGQVIHEGFKLLASDGEESDEFGWSIGIDNGIVAVGAFRDDDNGFHSGSAYLFDASTGAQIAKLLPSDGAESDRFGISIAIDNGVVAVGAYKDDDNGIDSGSAYLFDTLTGVQIAKLLPTEGAAGDQFGVSIAIDNGIVAVGARWDDDNGTDSGSAYLFDASTAAQIAKLLPSDGGLFDDFGLSIAIDNGVVGIGGSDAAYLFDASTGAQLAKLLPTDGAAYGFGFSIAIDNGVVVVGAYLDDHNGSRSGSAYLFDATTGAQISIIRPSDGAADDIFGHSIAINQGVVAVGAVGGAGNGGISSGAAYLFHAATGRQIVKLLSSDGALFDYFGFSIAIDNGVVAVGAILDDDNGGSSGSAYLFDTGVPCAADLNGDGEVNTQDFMAFLNAWASRDPLADWDDNGTVNSHDVMAYLNDWVAGC